MIVRRIGAELEGRFWQVSAPFRFALRAARRELALLGRRWRGETAIVLDPPTRTDPGVAAATWVPFGRPSRPEQGDPLAELRLIGDLEGLDWIARPAGELLVRKPETRAAGAVHLGRVVPGTTSGIEDRGASHPAPWVHSHGRRALAANRSSSWIRRPARRLQPPPATGERRSTAVLLLPFLAIGGAERLLLAYARAVAERRRLVVVTTEPRRAALGEARDALAPFAETYALGETLDRVLHPEALRAILARHDADVLACWNGCALFYELAPRLRREAPRLRLVNQLFDHRVGWIRRLTPALRASLDCTIAVNRPIADALRSERGFDPDRIALVRHGVAPPGASADRAAIRRELGIPEAAVVAASFLRFHPQKRPLDLVAVARRLAGEGLWLLLVGGGPLEGEVRAALARFPAENVVLLPFERDPERLFAVADLCLMASDYEGLPIFLLEGMARGLPAVATAVGEIPALLSEGAGLVAPPGDVDGLAAVVREMLDPGRRRTAGEVARRVVAERFSLERYVAETDVALYGGERAG